MQDTDNMSRVQVTEALAAAGVDYDTRADTQPLRDLLASMRDAPNVDALDVDGLHALAEQTRGVRPRAAARQLFGFATGGATRAARDLNNYAWNLITARNCRARGEIETALRYERICESIYEGLPAFARW